MTLRAIASASALLLAAIASTGCVPDVVSTTTLALALRQEFPGSRINVQYNRHAVHGTNSHYLALTVDDSASRRLPDSALATRGKAIARFALAHFTAAADVDSVSVMLVRERERHFLSESYSGLQLRWAAKDLH